MFAVRAFFFLKGLDPKTVLLVIHYIHRSWLLYLCILVKFTSSAHNMLPCVIAVGKPSSVPRFSTTTHPMDDALELPSVAPPSQDQEAGLDDDDDDEGGALDWSKLKSVHMLPIVPQPLTLTTAS